MKAVQVKRYRKALAALAFTCTSLCSSTGARAQLVLHAAYQPTVEAPSVGSALTAMQVPQISPVVARDELHAQALAALRTALKRAVAADSTVATATPNIEWPEVQAKLLSEGDPTPLVEASIELLAGKEVPRHIGLALKLAEQAAAQKDQRAMLLLASATAHGWGQPRDAARARAMLQTLQEQGVARAYCLQAEWDARLPGGATRRQVRAMLAAGAAKGDAVCLNAHGNALEQEGHSTEALAAYTKAAEMGHVTAQENVTRMQAQIDATKLRREASRLPALDELLRAAQAGDAQAQFDVARRFHRGAQAPHDLAAAFYWYSQAAQRLPAAREVFGLIVSQSPELAQGELDATSMQSLALLPTVASVEALVRNTSTQARPEAASAAQTPALNITAPVVQRPPVRDSSLLAGIERLAVARKANANNGVSTVPTLTQNKTPSIESPNRTLIANDTSGISNSSTK